MKKCEYYYTEVYKTASYSNGEYRLGDEVELGKCYGTRETEYCHCKGDRSQCDFYPEVREKARQEIRTEERAKSNKHTIDMLKFCLTSQERDGMVYIPRRMFEKIIEALECWSDAK